MRQVVKIHTNKSQKARKPQPKVVEKNAEWQSVFVDFSKILIVIIVAVSLLGFYTYINSQIQKTAKEISNLERDIKDIDREIENYTIAITELKSWNHINRQISKFDLNLQLPQAQQRQHITLLSIEQLRSKTPYANNNQRENEKKLELTNNLSMK